MYRNIATALLFVGSTLPAVAQDINAGKTVFAQCRVCHQVGEGAKHLVGPHLNGLFGRTAGTTEGYSYSDANKKFGKTWDDPTFTTYIKDPKGVVPGTKMAYIGLKDDKKIADLVAYLKSFGPDGKVK
ncbi:MAG TPA: cytochrome c family protein [Rhabdaerophilum sp.]|nr:cytochrome c family protein [Rhabdaerophilum sp.]